MYWNDVYNKRNPDSEMMSFKYLPDKFPLCANLDRIGKTLREQKQIVQGLVKCLDPGIWHICHMKSFACSCANRIPYKYIYKLVITKFSDFQQAPISIVRRNTNGGH